MMDGKKELVTRLGNQEALFYALMSGCTRAPYVMCDEETFDDAVMLFFDEAEAKENAKQLAEQKIPVTVLKLENRQMLFFFTNLYTMGVNALDIRMEKERCLVQIEEIVKRRDESEMPDGSKWVENPSLHLTALYFAQELRKPQTPDTSKRLAELQEELASDFMKGSFIFAIEKEGQGTPMVKLKDEEKYQPVFTDAMEFRRFNHEDKFRPVIVEASNLPKVLDKTAKGVILNIMGVNLPLTVGRPAAPDKAQG